MEQVLVIWGHSSVGEPSAKIIASALANCINTLSERNLIKLIVHFQFGDIAQLARAPALQAGGPGFESPTLHQLSFCVNYGVKQASVCNTPPKFRVGALSSVG